MLLRLSNRYKGDLGDYFRKMAESLSNPNPGNEEINRKIINFLEVNALQTIADIGMHVSMYESFGVAITELLWKGKLTIASTEGGISEQYPKEMQKDFLIDISEDYKGKLRDIENKYKKGEYDEELERMLNEAMDPSSELSEKMLRLLLLNDSEIEAKSQGLREYIRKRYLILNSIKEHLEYLLGNFPRGVNNLEDLQKSGNDL